MTDQKYTVIDHHSFWGWKKSNVDIKDADIVFVWNDFSIKSLVLKWRGEGKKIVCFEHGWNSFFDYEINNRKILADGYMTLGSSSAQSLLRYGLYKKKILIVGNPHFDNLDKYEDSPNLVPRILYTALHWTRDMREYNNSKLEKIIKELSPYSYISVKTIEKSKISIPLGVNEWRTCIYANKNLFKDTVEGLKEYDIILTPKESTFDFIALKMGKKVFRIGDEKEYRLEGDPRTRNVLPFTEISPEIFFKGSSIMTNIEDEIIPSLELKDILDWARRL